MKLRLSKNLIKVAAGLIAAVIVFIIIVLLLQRWERQHYSFNLPENSTSPGFLYDDEDSELDEIYYNGKWYSKRAGVETVLCIGVDKYSSQDASAGYVNTQQCDFLLLIILDHDAKTYTAFHLNRDTMTNINMLALNGEKTGSFTGQLALSHTYGSGGSDSCRNTVQAVSDLLSGTQIDNYIAVTMDAIPIINDAVGGVTLVVEDDFSQVEPKFVQGEEITLMGKDALTYVRTRMGLEDSSNLHRMDRQRQYLTALKEQFEAKAKSNSSLFVNTALSISAYMTSDCTIDELSDIYNATSTYKFTGFEYIEGEAVLGEKYMEFYPDEDALYNQIIKLFYEETDGDEED